jgi:hypothetical protein
MTELDVEFGRFIDINSNKTTRFTAVTLSYKLNCSLPVALEKK